MIFGKQINHPGQESSVYGSIILMVLFHNNQGGGAVIMLLGTIITALVQLSLVTAVSSVNHDEVGDGQGGQ